jgi:hypothetical protein
MGFESRLLWYGPGAGGLVWFARLNGVALLIVGILGWPLRTTPPLEWFNLSTAENIIHIFLSAALLYAGFVRVDKELARRAIALVGVVALLAAVLGFTDAPQALAEAGYLSTNWSLAHQVAHFIVAVVFGGVWLASGRERDRLVPTARLGVPGAS